MMSDPPYDLCDLLNFVSGSHQPQPNWPPFPAQQLLAIDPAILPPVPQNNAQPQFYDPQTSTRQPYDPQPVNQQPVQQPASAPRTQTLPAPQPTRPACPLVVRRRPQPRRANRVLGSFPRNAHLYPDKKTALPEGTSDKDVCRLYPNHLTEQRLLDMTLRGFTTRQVYENMAANTKRDKDADLALLRTRAFKANGRRALGQRRGKAEMAAVRAAQGQGIFQGS